MEFLNKIIDKIYVDKSESEMLHLFLLSYNILKHMINLI